MSGVSPVPTPAEVARHREYLVELVARDAAYDRDPAGPPPVRGPDYRRALLAVLGLPAVQAAAGAQKVGGGYGAGGRASAAAVVATLAAELSPERLQPRSVRQRVPPVDDADDEGQDADEPLAGH